MRLQIATILLVAGAVVGCASNPPPPPPMAAMPEAPPPPPPPAPAGPMAGAYKGMADLGADAPARCAKMTRAQTATVRGTTISLGGMRGKIGADGSVTPIGRSGLTGTVNGNTADLTAMKGKCSYHYTLTHS